MRSTLTTAFAAIALATGSADADDLTLAGVTLTYDETAWTAEPFVEDTIWILTCSTPDCMGRSRTPPFVYFLTRRDDGSGLCESPTAYIPATAQSAFFQTRSNQGGIDFLVTQTRDECRSLSPWMLEACAIHDGRAYWLTTGFSWGTSCGPVEKMPAARFEELLRGIAAGPPAPAAPAGLPEFLP